MKKYQLWIGALVLMLGTTIYAQDTSIYMDGKKVEMDVAPQFKNNTTYVPISFISTELGAGVKWENSKVIITKADTQIICTIGNKTVYKNGSLIQLPMAPYILSNRTFIPLRAISELLDCDVDYQKQNNSIRIKPNSKDDINQQTNDLVNPPKMTLLNHDSNHIKLPRKWNGHTYDDISTYQAVLTTSEATTNVYRPQVNEVFKFHFGKPEPEQVTVRMEYTTDDSIEASDFPAEQVPVTKNGDLYEFVHQPITAPEYTFGGRIYSIKATWGDNVCEYAFWVDNKWNLLAHQRLEERMKALYVLDYCVVGNWVYYATLGDQEGVHKMLLDGTQDTIICDFSNVVHLNGSTAVTSEYKGEYILYKMQPLRRYDANGELEPPHPADYYRLNLSDNTLEKINKVGAE